MSAVKDSMVFFMASLTTGKVVQRAVLCLLVLESDKLRCVALPARIASVVRVSQITDKEEWTQFLVFNIVLIVKELSPLPSWPVYNTLSWEVWKH